MSEPYEPKKLGSNWAGKTKSVFVGGLPPRLTDAELAATFSVVGQVTETYMGPEAGTLAGGKELYRRNESGR